MANTYPNAVGVVICPSHRPATPTEVWIELTSKASVALDDMLLIESPGQQLLGVVSDVQLIDERPQPGIPPTPRRRRGRYTRARLTILSSSDGLRRPPEGTTVRYPRTGEVTTLLAEARTIPANQRVPVGVLAVGDGFAPVFVHAARLAGPLATSAVLTGSPGSLKSTAGMLLCAGIQQVFDDRCALVLINSKGNDFLFADFGRDSYADRLSLRSLSERDYAIYAALGYPTPPVLHNVTVLVPAATDPMWRSARSIGFPRTEGYQLSHAVGLQYALEPTTDDDERIMTAITRQCLEEAAGPFAREHGLTTLPALLEALEQEFDALSSDRARWRGFQGTTLGAAVRQLRMAIRDLGPLLAPTSNTRVFPMERLAAGGTFVIDIAPLGPKAAQAVLQEVVNALWDAKARGVIPHDLPLVLLVDELNRWSASGPVAARLGAIVRDQRHRRFSLIGLAQQLSTLSPVILSNADLFSYGMTRSMELATDPFGHLGQAMKTRLSRLPPDQRIIDAWPLAQPLSVTLPYPSWLIADEGLALVERWKQRGPALPSTADALAAWQ